MKKKIDMTHRYHSADTHNSVNSFKRRMKDYETKVLAERKAKEKAALTLMAMDIKNPKRLKNESTRTTSVDKA